MSKYSEKYHSAFYQNYQNAMPIGDIQDFCATVTVLGNKTKTHFAKCFICYGSNFDYNIILLFQTHMFWPKFGPYWYKTAETHDNTYIKSTYIKLYNFMTSIMTRQMIIVDTP